MGSFEKLEVCRRSVALADEFHRAVRTWSGFDRWTTGVQLMRAVDSIGANIAEGAGRSSTADQRRLLIVARGSAYEAQHWIARADARGLACPQGAADRANRIGRMLNGLIPRL